MSTRHSPDVPCRRAAGRPVRESRSIVPPSSRSAHRGALRAACGSPPSAARAPRLSNWLRQAWIVDHQRNDGPAMQRAPQRGIRGEPRLHAARMQQQGYPPAVSVSQRKVEERLLERVALLIDQPDSLDVERCAQRCGEAQLDSQQVLGNGAAGREYAHGRRRFRRERNRRCAQRCGRDRDSDKLHGDYGFSAVTIGFIVRRAGPGPDSPRRCATGSERRETHRWAGTCSRQNRIR